ncbi:MAG: signal peptidase II [Bdellovibrionia bacterium]
MGRKYKILLALTSVIIVLDQVTKYLIVEKFRLGETSPMIADFFNLTYVQNKGAAFGLLSQADPSFRIPFFVIIPLVALSSIAYVFRKLPANNVKLAVALSLIISGAFGNLIDRMRLGYVIDFLDFHWKWTYHFPSFNVADSAICMGVALVMLDLFTEESSAIDKKGSYANASNTR